MQTDRDAFAERLRLQVQSRYNGVSVKVDVTRFALHVTAAGVDTELTLTPLFHACQREAARTPALIADFVSAVERQLTPKSGTEFVLSRLLWCVRSASYLDGIARKDDLLRHELGGDLVAFVAEALPTSVMRGVPAQAWRDVGLTDSDVLAATGMNTAARFAGLVDRIAATERVPGDGWSLSGDTLYQGSILMVPAVLEAFVERCQDDVLFANPDRAKVLALPASAPSTRQFAMRAVREWREAMNPASREVYVAGSTGLRALPRRKRGALLPWLHD